MFIESNIFYKKLSLPFLLWPWERVERMRRQRWVLRTLGQECKLLAMELILISERERSSLAILLLGLRRILYPLAASWVEEVHHNLFLLVPILPLGSRHILYPLAASWVEEVHRNPFLLVPILPLGSRHILYPLALLLRVGLSISVAR
jgi:hypothetical protein